MANVRLLNIKRRENPFVQMDKKVAFNRNLSWKAKGILTVLLGLKDGDDFNLGYLSAYSNDGEAATESGVKELKQKGYLEVKRWREDNGKFGWGFDVHEIPLNVLDVNLTKFTIVDNPNKNAAVVSQSQVEQLAAKYQLPTDIMQNIVTDLQPNITAVEMPKHTPSVQPLKQTETLKELVFKNEDLKTLCLDEYKIDTPKYFSLLNKFFEQKKVLSGSKTYNSIEDMSNHVFNWIGFRLKNVDNKPKTTPKNTQNTPPQYTKESVCDEVIRYKAMTTNLTEHSTYTEYREATKQLIYWTEIADKNNWIDDKQRARLAALKLDFETAGALKKHFDAARPPSIKTNFEAKNTILNQLETVVNATRI